MGKELRIERYIQFTTIPSPPELEKIIEDTPISPQKVMSFSLPWPENDQLSKGDSLDFEDGCFAKLFPGHVRVQRVERRINLRAGVVRVIAQLGRVSSVSVLAEGILDSLTNDCWLFGEDFKPLGTVLARTTAAF